MNCVIKFILLLLWTQRAQASAVTIYLHEGSGAVTEILKEQLQYYFGVPEEMILFRKDESNCQKTYSKKEELVLCIRRSGRLLVVYQNIPKLNKKFQAFREIDDLLFRMD